VRVYLALAMLVTSQPYWASWPQKSGEPSALHGNDVQVIVALVKHHPANNLRTAGGGLTA